MRDLVERLREIQQDDITLCSIIRLLARSRTASISCVSQERLFLKPCWASVRIFVPSRWCMMLLEIMIVFHGLAQDTRQ